MNRMSAARTPEVPGVDLAFRPKSYFWPMGLKNHLLARVKGAERNATLRRLIDAGDLDRAPDFLARSSLSEPERQMFGRVHPAFMGGEYLPNLTSNEVQIARVTIASTTQDVTCVYARRRKHRIHYRVVDEYQGDTLSGRTTRTSTRPLTLGELEAFLSGAWSIFHVLDMNFGRDGYDLNAMLQFVIGVESQFYPQIDALYRCRIEAWAAARRAELGLDRVDDDFDLVAAALKPSAAEEERKIEKIIRDDRKSLRSFVQYRNYGLTFDELDDDLKAWWLGRY